MADKGNRLRLTERRGTIHDKAGKKVGSFRLATSDPLLTEMGGDYLERLLTPADGGTVRRVEVRKETGKK